MKNNISLIQLNNYVKPEIVEVRGKEWVLNGNENSYFKYVKNRYIGSPTNAAIINAYINLLYGKGLKAKNASRHPDQYAKMLKLLPKKDLRKVVRDYCIYFNAAFQIIPNRDGTKSAKYIDVSKLAFDKVDEDGESNGFWHCENWERPNKFTPVFYPKYGLGNKSDIEILYINNSNDDSSYYSLPLYQSGLQYAEMEEEISNYYINHIKNGFSFGYIVNMNNGIPPTEEEREEIERRVKASMTGSDNAGMILISFNNGKDAQVEITPLEVSDSHKQWESVNKTAEEKIMRSHGVVSPMLFGIKDNTGLGNNADELQTAYSLTMDMRINPIQEVIIDAIEPLLSDNGIILDLYFEPLNQQEKQEENAQPTQLKEEPNGANFLIEKGEDIDLEQWELISEESINGRPVDIALSALQSSPSTKSEQDNDLFKVRYVYAGNPNPQRAFCRDMMKAKKVYRKEDIDAAETKIVQAGMGPKGTDTYSIWLYAGGVNCKHFWQRKIYLRRNNKKITVNEARRRILELEPEDRKDVRLPVNDPLVAQPAQASNNYNRLTSLKGCLENKE